jgi:hypothetical protein
MIGCTMKGVNIFALHDYHQIVQTNIKFIDYDIGVLLFLCFEVKYIYSPHA